MHDPETGCPALERTYLPAVSLPWRPAATFAAYQATRSPAHSLGFPLDDSWIHQPSHRHIAQGEASPTTKESHQRPLPLIVTLFLAAGRITPSTRACGPTYWDFSLDPGRPTAIPCPAAFPGRHRLAWLRPWARRWSGTWHGRVSQAWSAALHPAHSPPHLPACTLRRSGECSIDKAPWEPCRADPARGRSLLGLVVRRSLVGPSLRTRPCLGAAGVPLTRTDERRWRTCAEGETGPTRPPAKLLAPFATLCPALADLASPCLRLSCSSSSSSLPAFQLPGTGHPLPSTFYAKQFRYASGLGFVQIVDYLARGGEGAAFRATGNAGTGAAFRDCLGRPIGVWRTASRSRHVVPYYG